MRTASSPIEPGSERPRNLSCELQRPHGIYSASDSSQRPYIAQRYGRYPRTSLRIMHYGITLRRNSEQRPDLDRDRTLLHTTNTGFISTIMDLKRHMVEAQRMGGSAGPLTAWIANTARKTSTPGPLSAYHRTAKGLGPGTS